ncbi:MAG: 30S ribosomal protein S16 [Bacteroidetes bacterium]|nr:30S ribosomal protein S16 [Bacteroidota bacterium]
MPVKIRLQRHGKKNKPFYWIVAADARSKRDGRYLEKLGTYNPNTNPATIDLNIDGSVKWLHNGAVPTETARAILSYKGVLLKHHLEVGKNKGALTDEQVQAKFEAWLQEKDNKITSKKENLSKSKAEARAEKLAAEKATSEKRKAAAEAVEETPADEVAVEEAAEAQTPEATDETSKEAEA